jgi:predicted tellurium resistance membrane protein TerC
VEKHPTIKMLALSFLLLIGFTLIVEGLHQHIPKGYIYFAMGFSVLVEMLNMRLRAKSPQPVSLHEPYKAAVASGVASAVVGAVPKANQQPKKKNKRK